LIQEGTLAAEGRDKAEKELSETKSKLVKIQTENDKAEKILQTKLQQAL